MATINDRVRITLSDGTTDSGTVIGRDFAFNHAVGASLEHYTVRCDDGETVRVTENEIMIPNLFDHPTYREAIAADDHYSETIRRVTNGRRNRWTLTLADERHPDIRSAYDRFVAASVANSDFIRREIRFA